VSSPEIEGGKEAGGDARRGKGGQAQLRKRIRGSEKRRVLTTLLHPQVIVVLGLGRDDGASTESGESDEEKEGGGIGERDHAGR
jgi:hypothetical protein